jgi:hypothetical protein
MVNLKEGKAQMQGMGINNLPVPTGSWNLAAGMGPALSQNQVWLYKDEKWDGEIVKIDLNIQTQFDLVAVRPQNQASLVAFHLPLGRVVTLCENFVEWDRNKRDNLGRTADLVGTGKTQYVDLNVFMRDCVSAFYFRDVVVERGYFVLYEGRDRDKNRTIVFLDEWEEQKLVNIKRWFMQDKTSSLDFNLPYGDRVRLYDNVDGTGVSQACGLTTLAAQGDKLTGLEDKVSSFKWDILPPEREELGEIEIVGEQYFPISETEVFSAHGTYSAAENLPDGVVLQNGSVIVDQTREEVSTITIETAHEFFFSSSVTLRFSLDIAKYSSLKLTFETSTTQKWSRKVESKITKKTVLGGTYPVSPGTSWSLTAVLKSARISYSGKVPVTRWYKVPLPNSTKEGELYKIKFDIPVLVSGQLSIDHKIDYKPGVAA